MAIKFDNIKGAFVNTQTDEKVSQSELLMWTAENPMEGMTGVMRLWGETEVMYKQFHLEALEEYGRLYADEEGVEWFVA